MQLPVWTEAQLRERVETEGDSFDAQLTGAVRARASERFERSERSIRAVLDASSGLLDLGQAAELGRSVTGRRDYEYADVLRLLTMPPLGRDDVQNTEGRERHAGGTSEHARLVRMLEDGIDDHRFPWVRAQRAPTECELEAAVTATGTLSVSLALPVLTRHAAFDLARDFDRALEDLGWEELPKGVPLRLLPPQTFMRYPRGGPDLLARTGDDELFIFDVKVSTGGRATPWPALTRLKNDDHWKLDEVTEDRLPTRVLVLYGRAPVPTLLELQETTGVRIAFGHLVRETFDPDAPNLATDTLHDGGITPASPASPGVAIVRAEESVRAASASLKARLGGGARTGRLGRRQEADPADGYVGQYVHLGTWDEPRALWIYYAAEGHPYSVPGYPAGYWIGLKRDAAHELPEAEWRGRVPDGFTWMQHVDVRYSGFRHFFQELSPDSDPELVADTVAQWALASLPDGWA